MEEKIDLLNLDPDGLRAFMTGLGEMPYRGNQVFRWLYKNVKSFDDMSDISGGTRALLKERCIISQLEIVNKQTSKRDGTVKYALRTGDGNVIESVLMRYGFGNTICISTQVGCRMGCAFCASKKEGFVRSLTPAEMSSQVLKVTQDTGERIRNIVLMGIGEPLDNYDNVISFIKNMNNKDGLNIGYRHITLSTCGLASSIIKLAHEGLPINLSLSLHAAQDGKRKVIMPVALANSIDKTIEACNIYTEKTKRRVTFEYALINGFNDSREDALSLSRLLKGMLCHVNLIPLNKVEGLDYLPSRPKEIEIFKRILMEQNIPVSIRRKLGSDIDGACGQLRRRVIGR